MVNFAELWQNHTDDQRTILHLVGLISPSLRILRQLLDRPRIRFVFTLHRYECPQVTLVMTCPVRDIMTIRRSAWKFSTFFFVIPFSLPTIRSRSFHRRNSYLKGPCYVVREPLIIHPVNFWNTSFADTHGPAQATLDCITLTTYIVVPAFAIYHTSNPRVFSSVFSLQN